MSVVEIAIPVMTAQTVEPSVVDADVDSWKIQKALEIKRQLESLLFDNG